MQTPVHLLFLLCPNSNLVRFPHQRCSDFFWSSFLVKHDFFSHGCRHVAPVHYYFPPPPNCLNGSPDFTMTCRKITDDSLILSGMLETRCLSSSCSEGQPGFNCQTLSRSHSQLVGICGVDDATWVAVENPQFRYLSQGCGDCPDTCRKLGLLLWKKGRQICRKSGFLRCAVGRGRVFVCTKSAGN